MQGRGARYLINLGDGEIELIDDSYNANPVSMCAALDLLGSTRPKYSGRKIAILGDMLELGSDESLLHARLAENITAADVDLVFTVGSRMLHLREALSPNRLGAHAGYASQIVAPVVFALGRGDVVLVKGSQGSNMAEVVEALRQASNNLDTVVATSSH